jgi:hypothetical protein
VALLHRSGGGLTSALLRDLSACWGGPPAALPTTSSFLSSFPALFDCAPAGKSVRLSAPACARLRAGTAGGPRVEALLAAGDWPPRAAALLRATPLEWLPAATAAPDPAALGPIFEQLLAGGPLPVNTLFRLCQARALEAGLPLPVQRDCKWLLWSGHPAYARLRPVLAPGSGTFSVALSAGSVLEEDIAELRALAAAINAQQPAH